MKQQYDKQEIAQLLSKFMAGETSVTEEEVLAQYFRTHEVDKDWAEYKEMFALFDNGEVDIDLEKHMCYCKYCDTIYSIDNYEGGNNIAITNKISINIIYTANENPSVDKLIKNANEYLNYFKDYDKIMASIKEEDHMVLDYMEYLKDNITDCWHYCHDILEEDEIEDDPILRRLRRICEEEADDYGCEDATKYISEKYPDVYYSQT